MKNFSKAARRVFEGAFWYALDNLPHQEELYSMHTVLIRKLGKMMIFPMTCNILLKDYRNIVAIFRWFLFSFINKYAKSF